MPEKTHEGEEWIPIIRTRSFALMRGKKISALLEKVKNQNPAGEMEWEYILTHKSSKEAKKVKTGKMYFFFGSTREGAVRFVHWQGGSFQSGWYALDADWDIHCRAVLK